MLPLSLLVMALALLPPTLQQTTPLSPCPNVFMYEPPGSEPGRWYGVANLSTDSTLHSLWLNIVLDSKADILGNWIGDVTTTDNTDFKIENTKLKIQPGPATAVRFFVQYNPLNKVPRLQAIRLNGREICNANNPLPAVDRPDSDSTNLRPSKPERTTQRSVSRPDTSASRPEESVRPVSRPDSIDRPVSRPEYERPDSADRPISRPEYERPVSRPDSDRPVVRPDVRPEDRPISRPVQGRPSESGPVYIPTDNPPIAQSNVNPFSIGGGQVPQQNVGQQSRPDRRTTTTTRRYDEEDFVDDSKPVDESEYFTGGLVTIVTGHKNPSNFDGSNNRGQGQQGQCGKVVRNANPNPLVVNGHPTLEGQWPWQIALYQTQTVDNKYICGGTLVSPRHIITAAHCISRKGSNRVVNKNTLTVYIGKHNLRTSVEGVQIRLVGDIRVHPSYNASSYSGDLGILTLREPVQYTDWVRPACLWPDSQVELRNIIGKKGSVVGWGFDDKGVATEELTLVEMPVVDQETCIRSYSEFFARFTSDYTFCAGFRDGTSVCNGDSGGGMVFNMQGSWYLRGLVSLSVARQNEYRCDPTHYVVFTDLAKFASWIRENISEF